MTPQTITVLGAIWFAISPGELLDPQPADPLKPNFGSVLPSSYLRAKPVQTCPIYESGNVIGFSLGCRQTGRTANGLPLSP